MRFNMLGRFCGCSDPGEGVDCGGANGCGWTGWLLIGWFSAVSARLFCGFVVPGWEVACDSAVGCCCCCCDTVWLKLLEDVGVTGLVGWLVDEGSELASLVRFFFRKPRLGIKDGCIEDGLVEIVCQRPIGQRSRRHGAPLAIYLPNVEVGSWG